ncbi:hypothetical protein [Kineosporia babensis]|uniref:Uncharacterized protein n=1 Tax=Kineosporia babensis TaxID=499548 RepID=A0A9X1N9H9_9ACTN|nr:hypothetical protein [Kineosporia babensis]MCD5310852.1 hypothetical protein [Kineosporia babensis]
MTIVAAAITLQTGLVAWGIARLVPKTKPLTIGRRDLPDRWSQGEWELAA